MPKSKVRKKKKSKLKRNGYIQTGNNIKMSEIILDYVSPLIDEDPDDEDIEGIITLGILVWNIALTPEEEKEEHKREVIETLTNRLDITEEYVKELIEIMLQRKYEEFGDIRRFIIDYDILYKGGEHVLNISSSDV